MNNKGINLSLNNVNEEALNQLRQEAEKGTYHRFKIKMEDGSVLDLIEKKDYEQLQQENQQLKEDYAKIVQDNCYTLELENRIDKALEVLEKDGDEYQCVDYMSEAWRILKGE